VSVMLTNPQIKSINRDETAIKSEEVEIECTRQRLSKGQRGALLLVSSRNRLSDGGKPGRWPETKDKSRRTK